MIEESCKRDNNMLYSQSDDCPYGATCCVQSRSCYSRQSELGVCTGSHQSCHERFGSENDWYSSGCEGGDGCCYPVPTAPELLDSSPFFVGSAVAERYTPANLAFYLTNAEKKWQTGAIWWGKVDDPGEIRDYRVDVTFSFQFYFQAYFGSFKEGGEGIVFAIQNDGVDALETTGGHFLGYGYKPGNQTSYDARVKRSVGIEFDTYKYPDPTESSYGEYRNEISSDHIAVLKDGDIMNPISGVPIPAIADQTSIKDYSSHEIWIKYDVERNQLSVYFDDENAARLTTMVDIREVVQSDLAYWGFTASTGELINEHRIFLRRSKYLTYYF